MTPFTARVCDVKGAGGSLADAAYKTRKPLALVEAEWKRIIRVMGKQAR